VVVSSYGSCTGATSDYSIAVHSGTTPNLTQSVDDAELYTESTTVYSIDGSGTITP
jgi:hypothetical protein